MEVETGDGNRGVTSRMEGGPYRNGNGCQDVGEHPGADPEAGPPEASVSLPVCSMNSGLWSTTKRCFESHGTGSLGGLPLRGDLLVPKPGWDSGKDTSGHSHSIPVAGLQPPCLVLTSQQPYLPRHSDSEKVLRPRGVIFKLFGDTRGCFYNMRLSKKSQTQKSLAL